MGLIAQQWTHASMCEMRDGTKEEQPMRHTLHVNIETNIK